MGSTRCHLAPPTLPTDSPQGRTLPWALRWEHGAAFSQVHPSPPGVGEEGFGQKAFQPQPHSPGHRLVLPTAERAPVPAPPPPAWVPPQLQTRPPGPLESASRTKVTQHLLACALGSPCAQPVLAASTLPAAARLPRGRGRDRLCPEHWGPRPSTVCREPGPDATGATLPRGADMCPVRGGPSAGLRRLSLNRRKLGPLSPPFFYVFN